MSTIEKNFNVIYKIIVKSFTKIWKCHLGNVTAIGLNHEIAILAEVVMKTRLYLQTNCNGVLQCNDVSKWLALQTTLFKKTQQDYAISSVSAGTLINDL